MEGRILRAMDLEKIEEAMKKMVESLDKAARLEAVLEDKDEFRVILSKGTHSDRATLSREVLEDFLERGKGGHEVKKAIGKVISKLNLAAQKRK
jgi:ribosome-associated translation inhibitor RaiA